MTDRIFQGGIIVLPDRLLERGHVTVSGSTGRIQTVSEEAAALESRPDQWIDLEGGYLVPGYVDLHVHGGDGADFMDGTVEAFRTVCAAHARHGTTSLLPTTTVARHDQHLAFLESCQRLMHEGTGGARILGALLRSLLRTRGPRLSPQRPGAASRGGGVRPVSSLRRRHRHSHGGAGVARGRGVRASLPRGASAATPAIPTLPSSRWKRPSAWGIRHVDHLFCAMSDRARLRQTQTYPMRGGVLEATLFFDELTTEVIADGKHLQRELLLLAHKIKGPDRLALVTDCNRALDLPDGDYIFGPRDGGERIVRRDGVGIMPDGKSLASGVVGMDECVRMFHRLTGVPLVEVIRMATLTPSRIAGRDAEVGSIAPGKRADLLVLDRDLNVKQVYIDGRRWH